LKNYYLACFAALATSFCLNIQANQSIVTESKPVGSAPSLSKEQLKKGIENGEICTDVNGLANSRGAVMINKNGKIYQCVKSYGENLEENSKLVWVEIVIKDGNAYIVH